MAARGHEWKSAGGDGGWLMRSAQREQSAGGTSTADGGLKYVNLQVTGRGGGQWHLVLDRGSGRHRRGFARRGESHLLFDIGHVCGTCPAGELDLGRLDQQRTTRRGRQFGASVGAGPGVSSAGLGRRTIDYFFDSNDSVRMTCTRPIRPSRSATMPVPPGRRSASARMLERGRRSIAGGDCSTMRVLPYHLPLVADRGEGCRLWDIDGNEYIDLNMAFGPLLLGHRPRHVIEAVTRQISERGSQLGFPTEITIRVAEKIKQLFPCMELMRFANSGTEACASAVRLAKTYTGRRKLIMFEGHYHGWSEAVFNRYHAPLDQLPAEGFGPAIPGTTRHGRQHRRRDRRRVEQPRRAGALPGQARLGSGRRDHGTGHGQRRPEPAARGLSASRPRADARPRLRC